ncbi:MAG TPA: hypothetical protein VF420_07930 [Casimicrobiaceae bacterium]
MTSRPLLSIVAAVVIALAICSPVQADKAKEAGPEDGILCCGGITPFVFQGDKVMVVTGRAGIFRSESHGQKWQRGMQGLVAPNGVEPFPNLVCQSRSSPDVVYALAGIDRPVSPFNGLFSSNDFGKNWTRQGAVDTGLGFNVCAVDAADPRTVYVSGFDSVTFDSKTWRSTDGGRTVQEISAMLPPCAVGGLVITAANAIYVDNFQCVALSTDGGASFHLISTPGDFVAGFDVSADGRTIFLNALDASFNFLGTFRSTDAGATYAATTGLPFGFDIPIGFDPTNPSRVYAADGLQAYVSQDGGLTFTGLPPDPRFLGPVPAQIVGVDGHGSVYVAGVPQIAPFRSDDGGNTYSVVQNEFRASSVSDLAFDAAGNLLVGVIHTQAVFRKGNDNSFSALGTSLIDPNGIPGITVDTESIAASPVDPNIVLVATTANFGLVRTANGGQSWTPASVPGDPDGLFRSRMSFPTPSRVYLVAVYPPGLYRSDDAGVSFAQLSNLQFGTIAVHPTNPDTLYVGTLNDTTGIFKSTDGGQTLQSLNRPGDFSAIAVDNKNPQVIYAGETSGQVIRSLDGGQTFAAASIGLTGAGVHGLAQDSKGTLYVWLRGGGLFSSKDRASTWQKVDSDEALRRSGVEAGRGSLVADPRQAGRVYLGNSGVIQVGP